MAVAFTRIREYRGVEWGTWRSLQRDALSWRTAHPWFRFGTPSTTTAVRPIVGPHPTVAVSSACVLFDQVLHATTVD